MRPAPASSPADARPAARSESARLHGRGKRTVGLALAALGIVFGDIGTSPLYAFRECFGGAHAVPATPQNVLGILSLIFWSLIVVISIKYVALILRADNRGEGGILALMALALQGVGGARRRRAILVGLGLFGAALLYGDGMITPAISVLSAVEGLKVITPVFEPFVIPIALAIIVALFVVQRHGTARVGRIFGPITLVWFAAIGVLGVSGIVQYPAVARALNPLEAVRFFAEFEVRAFLVLGAVFLVVTGGEALYADMGHFGRRPIRLAWFAVVLPALVLNYFGQGALLLTRPEAAENPFFLLAPGWALIPLVVLATLATVIASQALISGAFSLTRQAVQLAYSPRFEIIHTSSTEMGQIYLPQVNWTLMVGVIALIIGFKSSSGLAAAYGIAVTLTMAITTVLAFFVETTIWRWRLFAAIAVTVPFLLVDLSFFGANAVKFASGGWFPLALAAVIFTLMATWKQGRQILSVRLWSVTLPLDAFLRNIAESPPPRVPGDAVFMTSNPEGVPSSLMHSLKHYKVLHERVILLTIVTAEVPHVPRDQQLQVVPLPAQFFRVVARYGFMETPDVSELIRRLAQHGLSLRMMTTTFFLGRETLIPTKRPGMALWREWLFAWMSRNAQPATAFFNLPPNRVVELGAQVEL